MSDIKHSNINPLLKIAQQVSYLDHHIMHEKGKTALREAKAHRQGLIDAAAWLLMAEQEKATGSPVAMPTDEMVEQQLNAIMPAPKIIPPRAQKTIDLLCAQV